MCPLCYGASAALVALILGPLGYLVARKDPLVIGAVYFVVPLAAMQAAGWYLGGLEVVKYLWLSKVFIPWWFYAATGGVFFVRIIRAYRLGVLAKRAEAAQKAASL